VLISQIEMDSAKFVMARASFGKRVYVGDAVFIAVVVCFGEKQMSYTIFYHCLPESFCVTKEETFANTVTF